METFEQSEETLHAIANALLDYFKFDHSLDEFIYHTEKELRKGKIFDHNQEQMFELAKCVNNTWENLEG